VEPATRVSKSVLARGELTKVTSCLGDCVVEELEYNAPCGPGIDCDVELIVFEEIFRIQVFEGEYRRRRKNEMCFRTTLNLRELTKTFALEFGDAGGEFSFSTAYTGRAERTARLKYIVFPADADVVNRRRNEAIRILLLKVEVVFVGTLWRTTAQLCPELEVLTFPRSGHTR
jgi:hypothetical protein